jgi:hypothetical protein
MVIQLLSGYGAGPNVGERLESAERGGWSSPRCPSCEWPLDEELRYRRMLAASRDADEDPVSVRIFFCGRCGVALGSLGGDPEVAPPTERAEPFDVQED